jgi:hypothetical protein
MFGPFGAWVTQQTQTPVPARTVEEGPTMPIGKSSRPIQPVNHKDYSKLSAQDWVTVLRLYALYRRVGKERRWCRQEIKGAVLEQIMWAPVMRPVGRGKGSSGG